VTTNWSEIALDSLPECDNHEDPVYSVRRIVLGDPGFVTASGKALLDGKSCGNRRKVLADDTMEVCDTGSAGLRRTEAHVPTQTEGTAQSDHSGMISTSTSLIERQPLCNARRELAFLFQLFVNKKIISREVV
jgi:hypothetical protein